MKSFILALFVGFSLFSNAQNKVIGTIVNKENIPLSGVFVSIPEIHLETTSDDNGNYQLNNLPNRKLKIFYSHLGYIMLTK